MGLGKQAKVLSHQQVDAVLAALSQSRNPIRNRLIFLLSVRAGLRAKEIACLRWEMVSNSEGAVGCEIALPDRASKGSSGRTIPLSRELRECLRLWKAAQLTSKPDDYVIRTERSRSTSAQVIINLFGCW